MGDFVALETTRVLNFERNDIQCTVDYKILVLEGGERKSKTELKSWGDVVLVIPSVPEVVLLGVRGVPAIIGSWVLFYSHVLLIILVWDSEGKFG